MASIQTASVNTLAYLQRKNKITYVSLVVLLSIFLLLDYIPGYSTWVTPPVALFLGLIFALSSGQAHPKFNKKVSKYLLQYSVVGLGFGMNLQASLASGKVGEGINSLARKTLTITLFFIGASLSRDVLKAVGIKPLIQGVLLWVTISVSTLAYIYWF